MGNDLGGGIGPFMTDEDGAVIVWCIVDVEAPVLLWRF